MKTLVSAGAPASAAKPGTELPGAGPPHAKKAAQQTKEGVFSALLREGRARPAEPKDGSRLESRKSAQATLEGPGGPERRGRRPGGKALPELEASVLADPGYQTAQAAGLLSAGAGLPAASGLLAEKSPDPGASVRSALKGRSALKASAAEGLGTPESDPPGGPQGRRVSQAEPGDAAFKVQVLDLRRSEGPRGQGSPHSKSGSAGRVEANPSETGPVRIDPGSLNQRAGPQRTAEGLVVVETAGFEPEPTAGKDLSPGARRTEGLYRSLQEQANSQIVDQARIVLREGNQGEIRLILRPDSLGEVRIRLQVEEGRLAGQILVENQNVKEVFQNNLENLLQSFRDGGFADLDLQVDVGSRHGQGEAQARESARPEVVPGFLAPVVAVRENPAVQPQPWRSGQLSLFA